MAALLVGLVLTTSGVTLLGFSWAGPTTGRILLCCGLGIVLGAFGAKAEIPAKGFVVTGVAAVAMLLFWAVSEYIEKESVIVEISGVSRGDMDGAILELQGDDSFHVRQRGGRNSPLRYEFLVFRSSAARETYSLAIAFPPGTQHGEAEYLFCVPNNEIDRYVGAERTLEWRFHLASYELKTTGGRLVADANSCGGVPRTGPVSIVRHFLDRIGFPAALAQSGMAIHDLLPDLESDAPIIRREARSALASLGPEAVRPMLDWLAQDPNNYRVRLGVSVALAEMLRASLDWRPEISSVLEAEDFELLVAAAADNDRTVRIYASEFLYDLGDPEVIDIAFQEMEAASPNGVYQLIFTIEGAYAQLRPEAQEEVREELLGWRGRIGSQTDALIDRIVQE